LLNGREKEKHNGLGSMTITHIEEHMWPAILALQSEAYYQIEPEDLETMHSKWRASPSCCFVYQNRGDILGYLLAHAWNSEEPPKLSQVLEQNCSGSILFLHDLAVSQTLKGQGVGHKMMDHLLKTIAPMNFKKINLVAIQGSVPFWQNMGFSIVTGYFVGDSYGDDVTLMQRILTQNN
jgi:predicted N-acetyltransferase YhbS